MPIQYFSRGPQGPQGAQGQSGSQGAPGPKQFGMEMDSQERNVLKISIGRKTDRDGNIFDLRSEFRKTADGFSEGSENGCMVSELVRDQIYAIFAITKDDGTVDFCVCDNFSEPPMPSGFTRYILVSSIRTNQNGQFAYQIQKGNFFRTLEDVGFDFDGKDLPGSSWYRADIIAPPQSVVTTNLRVEREGEYNIMLRQPGSMEPEKADKAVMAFNTDARILHFQTQIQWMLDVESTLEFFSEGFLNRISFYISGWQMPNLGGF